MKRYVLVFDVCSSTIIVENLIQNERAEEYTKLIDGYWAFLHAKRDQFRYTVYKFLGDGFILLFEENVSVDDILIFYIELVFFSSQLLIWFKQAYLDIANLPREGITAGLSFGTVHEMQTINITNLEYVGRPINMSCRLQKTLTNIQHTNRILLHSDLYRNLRNLLFKKACRETTRKLKNISGDTEIRCYEFNPQIFLDSDWNKLSYPIEKTKELVESNKIYQMKSVINNLQGMLKKYTRHRPQKK